MRKEETS
ncbi:hypothetical protein RDI58_020299 [Solanum bulbocastanum]